MKLYTSKQFDFIIASMQNFTFLKNSLSALKWKKDLQKKDISAPPWLQGSDNNSLSDYRDKVKRNKKEKRAISRWKKMYFSKRVIIINWKIWMTDSKNGIQTNLKAYTVRSKRVWALGPAGLDIDFICSFSRETSWPENSLVKLRLHEINFHFRR